MFPMADILHVRGNRRRISKLGRHDQLETGMYYACAVSSHVSLFCPY